MSLRVKNNDINKSSRNTKSVSKSATKKKVSKLTTKKRNNSKKPPKKNQIEAPIKSKNAGFENDLKLGETTIPLCDQKVGKQSQETKTYDETVNNSKTSPQKVKEKAKNTPEIHESEQKTQGMY